jgi:acetyl esterase/lipase
MVLLLIRFFPTETAVYQVIDNQELKLYIFKPEDQSAEEPNAALIYAHGGSWVQGSPIWFFPYARDLARRGLVVISIDYRLRGEQGPSPYLQVDDIKSAVKWVKLHAEQLNIDTQRMVLAGDSAGGHLAAAAAVVKTDDKTATFKSSIANALVLFNPVTNTNFNSENPAHQGFIQLFGNNGRSISPIHHINDQFPPTIILHGNADRMVPIQESEKFCGHLNNNGVECQLHAVDGAAHGFFKFGRGYYADSLTTISTFLEKHAFISAQRPQ